MPAVRHGAVLLGQHRLRGARVRDGGPGQLPGGNEVLIRGARRLRCDRLSEHVADNDTFNGTFQVAEHSSSIFGSERNSDNDTFNGTLQGAYSA